jgi:hypothetical protein
MEIKMRAMLLTVFRPDDLQQPTPGQQTRILV